jgi:hypothetical protein
MRALAVAATVLAVAGLTLVPTAGAHADGARAASDPGVQQAEVRLNQLGCDAGRPDGRADRHTRTGVIRFQSANGLRQTGHFLPATVELLAAPEPVRCDQRPVPARSGDGRRIVVSQSQNYVWLVRDSGSVSAEGPMVDNARVLHPSTNHAGSKCGRGFKIRHNHGSGLRLDDFVRFAPCGIGFHRVPVGRSGQIHPDWILGTDYSTSHGCIRVSRRVSEQIWDFTSAGTEVRVVR